MTVYALLFLYFAAGAAFEQSNQRARGGRPSGASVLLRFGGLLIALVVGLRYQVGADWFTYLQIFHLTSFVDFSTALGNGDPGYQALNWLVQQTGADVWLVNLVCAAIFAWGLIRFAEGQPRPWLAMVVAVPYLVIVVAQGYTRQAVAIGIIMAGMASFLRNGSVLRLCLYALVAALFHKTAVAALPLLLIGNGRSRLVTAVIGLAITYELYDILLQPQLGGLVEDYSSQQSQGAMIRVVMTCVAAGLFFLRGRRLTMSDRERVAWRNFSVAALGCLVMLFISPGSTATDRLALYLIPLQLAVLSRPRVASTTEGFGTALVIVYSGFIEFIWLTFAQHAQYWLPYRFWPFVS